MLAERDRHAQFSNLKGDELHYVLPIELNTPYFLRIWIPLEASFLWYIEGTLRHSLCCDSLAALRFLAAYHFCQPRSALSSDVSISPFASDTASEVYNHSGGAERVTVVSDLPGDLNADFRTNLSDWSVFLSNMGKGPNLKYIDGNINGDGYVDHYDFKAFKENLNKTLMAPADFNEDFAVDKTDMFTIGNHWHTAVTAHADGDANGEGYVDGKDFNLFNAAYLYTPWTPPHATSPGPGDLTADGLVDNDDSSLVLSCITSSCSPQDFSRADINHDGVVDGSDLQVVLSNWDPNGPADVNNDLKINNDDIAVIFHNGAQQPTWKRRTVI
jgi:hypothetical protein